MNDSTLNSDGLIYAPARTGMSCILGMKMLMAGGKIAVLDIGPSSEMMIQEAEQRRRSMRVGRKMNSNSTMPKQVPHWHRFTKGLK